MIKLYYSQNTYAEISHLINNLKEDEKINSSNIIIAEDRFTLTLEQQLLQNKREKGTFSTNVYSFQRLYYTLSKNQKKANTLTKTGGVMAISKILNENKNQLLCYKNIASSYSTLSLSLYNIIEQLKSSKITPQDLNNGTYSQKALQNKIFDIAKIYSEYENYKQSELFDACDMCELLNNEIPKSTLIKNSKIYIIGFTSFTKQFYDVIFSLFDNAYEVTLYILDGNNEVYDKSVKHKILKHLSNSSHKFTENTLQNNLTLESSHISNYLFSFIPQKAYKVLETNKVELFQGVDFVEELNNACIEILHLVRIKGYKYSDIFILLPNISDNVELVKREFMKYDIPIFIDNKILLSDHILSRVIMSILSLSGGDKAITDLLNLLYSPYFDLDTETKYAFENYLLKYGVNQKRLKKQLEDENFEKIKNRLLDFIITINKTDCVENYCNIVSNLVKTLSTKNNTIYQNFINANEPEQAQLTLQAEEKFILVLNEMTSIMGSHILPFDDFVKILKDGLVAKELSIAPLFVDNVFVGDFSSSKLAMKNALFALNVNTNLVPIIKKDVGLISDRDIDNMTNSGIDLEPKIELVNDREKLNVFLALHNFRDLLYISYSSFDLSNNPLAKSEVVTTISKIFTKNGTQLVAKLRESINIQNDKELSQYLTNNVTTKKIGLNIASQCFSKITLGDSSYKPIFSSIYNSLFGNEKKLLNNLFEKSETIVENAFSNKTLFSVSDLESYFSCPYKNFIQHSLYAKERETSVIRANHSGNYLHRAMELFTPLVEKIPDINSPLFTLYLSQTIDKLHTEAPYSILYNLPKTSFEIKSLDEEFYRVAQELVERKSKVSFSTLGEELSFGKNGSTVNIDGKKVTLSPYNLSKEISLHGKIDHADRYNNYVRVIDYKTGKIDYSLNSIYTGKKFQPFIYLAALRDQLELTPSAALYFPIHDQFSKEEDTTPYKMKGQVINDFNVLKAMDKNIEGGKAQYISVGISPKGNVINSKGTVLSNLDFDCYIEYSKKLALKACNEIKKGFISPKPYKYSCTFCAYSSICGYDYKVYGEREIIEKIEHETIIRAVEND